MVEVDLKRSWSGSEGHEERIAEFRLIEDG